MAQNKKQSQPETTISITLPGAGGIQKTGTVIVQRGELGTIRQFPFTGQGDVAHFVGQAFEALKEVEAQPPAEVKLTEKDKAKAVKAPQPETGKPEAEVEDWKKPWKQQAKR